MTAVAIIVTAAVAVAATMMATAAIIELPQRAEAGFDSLPGRLGALYRDDRTELRAGALHA